MVSTVSLSLSNLLTFLSFKIQQLLKREVLTGVEYFDEVWCRS